MSAGYRPGQTWDTYSRISDDPNDLQNGVRRQQEDTRAAVESVSGILGQEHTENDTSAYRKRKVKVTDTSGNTYDGWRVIRPVWHGALQRLRTGAADGLMVYDLDRLARDPRDLEDAIEVVEHYGRSIVSATASEVDLTTESGRLSARLMVMIAQKSSADTSRRVKRAALDNALAGKPVGKRAFGWQEGNRLLDRTEAALVRAAVRELIEGSTNVTAVSNRWTDAGVRTARGNPWRNVTLRQYLRHPRLAGYRVHQRQIVHGADGNPVMGQWEPLLDIDTWERLQAVLTGRDSRGRVPKKSSRHYLLTGLLRCGICNSLMYGNRDSRPGQRGFHYRCVAYRASSRGVDAHTQSVSGPLTDEAVTAVVLAHLAAQTDTETPREPEPWPGEDDLVRAERKVRELMAAFNSDELPGAVVFPQVREWEAKAAALGAQRREWLGRTRTGPSPSGALDEWAERVAAGDRDWQRALFSRVLDAVMVRPRDPRRTGFDLDRLAMVWRRS